jgi:bifunctional non-homologous end joining protein LigD
MTKVKVYGFRSHMPEEKWTRPLYDRAVPKMPEWLEPMAATLTQERFSGPEWLFERKFDGIRLLAYKRGADVQLFSRNRLPQHLPAVAQAVAKLPVKDAILDGEVAWDGSSSYHVFDVLWINGKQVTDLPLEERRAILKTLPFTAPLRRVELLKDDNPWERARREGWEGVIAKRRGSIYEHRRSKQWLKLKVEASQELVVGGFTDPEGARVGLGALLVGYYDPSTRSGPPRPFDKLKVVPSAVEGRAQSRGGGDDFVFAGKIGTGFNTALLLDLRRRLDALEIATPPFTRAIGLPRLRAHWVRPKIVVQVSFMEWTVHGKLRHPRLVGVRFDKKPREVVREQ